MNAQNVVSLNTFRTNSQAGRMTFLDSLHSEGVFYDVVKGQHTYVDPTTGDRKATGRVDLINGQTGKFISNMSKSYTVVQNKDIFEALDRQIAASGLDITGAYTMVDIHNDGAAVAVRYVFPAHRIEVGNGDYTDLMITAINSFNGTSGFAIYLGGFRGYCMNTQVFGTTIVQYRKKHCAGLSIEKAADIIRSGIDVFCQEGEAWKTMRNTRIDRHTGFKALADLAGVKGYDTYGDYMVDARKKARTTKLENYMTIFDTYMAEMGCSEFALYNAITHITTHGAAKSGRRVQAASTFETRQKETARVCKKYLTAYQQAA